MSKLQTKLIKLANKILAYGVNRQLLIDFERIAVKRYEEIKKVRRVKND